MFYKRRSFIQECSCCHWLKPFFTPNVGDWQFVFQILPVLEGRRKQEEQWRDPALQQPTQATEFHMTLEQFRSLIWWVDTAMKFRFAAVGKVVLSHQCSSRMLNLRGALLTSSWAKGFLSTSPPGAKHWFKTFKPCKLDSLLLHVC